MRRHTWLIAVLFTVVLEYLLVSFGFDAQPLRARNDAFAVLGWMGAVGPWMLTCLFAVLLLVGARLRTVLAGLPARPWRQRLVWLIAHLATYATFFVLTMGLFGGRQPPTRYAVAWLATWLLLGGASMAMAALAVFSPASLRRLFRAIWRPGALAVGLGSLAWLGGLGSAELWDPLRPATLHGVITAVGWLGRPVVADVSDAIVGTDQFQVHVAPVCSGYEGIGLMVVFLAGYIVAFRHRLRFPEALLLLPIGIVAAWIGNVARITALIAVGTWISPNVAVGAFHSKAGWLFFCAIALALAGLGRCRPFAREAPPDEEPTAGDSEPPDATAAYLMPLLVWIAAALVTGAFASGPDPLYPLHALLMAGTLYYCRDRYPPLVIAPGWLAPTLGVAVGLGWLAWPQWVSAGGSTEVRPPFDGAWQAAWLVVRALGAIVLVPIVEELGFRGYMMRRLVSRKFEQVEPTSLPWWTYAVSALAFGMLHQRWLAGIIAGLVYAFIYTRRGRIADAIVAHASSNAVIATYALATRDWAAWM